jgi:hypothetical protein
MTKKQRRQIYWDMYFCAVGLAMMTVKQIGKYNRGKPGCNDNDLPFGFCRLYWAMARDINLQKFVELKDPRPENYNGFWYECGNWKIRTDALLKAIEKTYE